MLVWSGSKLMSFSEGERNHFPDLAIDPASLLVGEDQRAGGKAELSERGGVILLGRDVIDLRINQVLPDRNRINQRSLPQLEESFLGRQLLLVPAYCITIQSHIRCSRF